MKHLNYLPFVVFFLAVWFWVYVLLNIYSTFQPAQEARGEAFVTGYDTLVVSMDSTEQKSDTLHIQYVGKYGMDSVNCITIDSILLVGRTFVVRPGALPVKPSITVYYFGGEVPQNGSGSPKQNIYQLQKDF